MSNGSVNVHVDTSAIAAEVSRLSSHIDGIAYQVQANTQQLHSDIRTLQAEVLGGIAATWERLNTIRTEITRGIEAEAQAKILEQFSEISGKIALISSSANRLSQQYNKSIVRIGRLNRKFDKLNDDIVQSYHTDIRRLGKYIFDIWETHYHKTVESRIRKLHTGFLTTIHNSIDRIKQMREERLSQLLALTSSKLEGFIKRRENFQTSVKSIKVKSLPSFTGEIAIPMIILRKDQQSVGSVITGCEVKTLQDKSITYELSDSDIFRSLRTRFVNLDKCLSWRKMTAEEINKFEKDLERLVHEGYVSKDYLNHLLHALRQKPPLVPENFFEYPPIQADLDEEQAKEIIISNGENYRGPENANEEIQIPSAKQVEEQQQEKAVEEKGMT